MPTTYPLLMGRRAMIVLHAHVFVRLQFGRLDFVDLVLENGEALLAFAFA
jgi:hypothetical protein